MNDAKTTAGAPPGSQHADSDLLAELDALIEANRAEPTADRQERILDLRLRAGEVIDTSPTTRVEAPADPFPTDGVPELVLDELDARQLARGFHHHGALLVRGLLTAEQVDLLRADLDSLVAARVAAESAPGEAAGRVLGGAGNRQADESPEVLAHMLDALAASGLTAIVTEYLGARPVAISERVRLRRSRQGLPWHQDAAFYGGIFGAVNAWVALTPCGVERDGLAVIPRHVDEIVGGVNRSFSYGKDTFTPEIVDRLCAGRAIVTPTFEAGDALLFDELTVHRTHVIRDAVAPRDVAVTWFFSPDRFPEREFPGPWTKLVI